MKACPPIWTYAAKSHGTGAPGRGEGGAVLAHCTGGMLPAGADAVVIVEYTEELDKHTIGITGL